MGFGKTMTLFRSEEMQLMQLMMPAESAHDTITALGELGLLQFKDLNYEKSGFQRAYASQVKRCDEMARKLRFFSQQVEKAGLPVGGRGGIDREYDLDGLEGRLEELETELVELNGNAERLQRSHAELGELSLVLDRASRFFEDDRSAARSSTLQSSGGPDGGGDQIDAPLLSTPSPEPKSVRLGFVAGTIQQEKIIAFERLLFRATRGNMYLRTLSVGSVVDPTTTEKQEKSVFVVFFAGERARSKILKICDAYNANRYPFPEEPARQRQMNGEVTARLRELHTTIEAGERHREGVLHTIATSLSAWILKVKREKAVYHTLNKLSVDVTRKVLVAEAWCPVMGKDRVHDALRSATQQSSASVGTVFQPLMTYEQPPTYFCNSMVTGCFQEIVDAYGMARYREANPMPFTVVTFPFLFAVMFGDIGHGFLMLLFAAWMLINEKKMLKQQLDEILGMMFAGRYCIFFMSLFSIYTGMLYNEFFSIPLTIFGKGHWVCESNPELSDRVAIAFNPSLCPSANKGLVPGRGSGPYAMGVDPTWHGTKTELPYLNSLKMKMSVIIGIVQMNGGIILSYFNQRYFRDSLSTWCEFIPQLVFLNALFGYLCILIIAKWASGSIADLYHVMIYMFLSPGNGGLECTKDAQGNTHCKDSLLPYPFQGYLQVILLLAALVAVPVMLIPKPLVLRKRAAARSAQIESYGRVMPHDPDAAEDEQSGTMHIASAGHHEEEFDFGEVAVHQMIHTIEFVLGAVSNTASYLRLWALSLAHSQLSAVFYDRVLMTAISTGQWYWLVIGFFVFACATLGVLMVMESLSAFLHALRLHWVEFQGKFYHGDGYKFAPFAFSAIDQEEL
ncbi:hypothetical protein WJX73_009975 [Symbiochloris irregularis]|uniref:V-type proton ATPase subunit a n=1 Tax=Symbiochloris irregularis TaxID=706552 RepID=A0AAW1NUG3_9CHLO